MKITPQNIEFLKNIYKIYYYAFDIESIGILYLENEINPIINQLKTKAHFIVKKFDKVYGLSSEQHGDYFEEIQNKMDKNFKDNSLAYRLIFDMQEIIGLIDKTYKSIGNLDTRNQLHSFMITSDYALKKLDCNSQLRDFLNNKSKKDIENIFKMVKIVE